MGDTKCSDPSGHAWWWHSLRLLGITAVPLRGLWALGLGFAAAGGRILGCGSPTGGGRPHVAFVVMAVGLAAKKPRAEARSMPFSHFAIQFGGVFQGGFNWFFVLQRVFKKRAEGEGEMTYFLCSGKLPSVQGFALKNKTWETILPFVRIF